MVLLKLVRIDHRLIHGQVMTLWTKEQSVDHILVIDDALSADEFMKEIYKMTVPDSIKVEILSISEAAKKWKDKLFSEGDYLVLFKNEKSALESKKAGFDFNKIQVGNMSADSNSVIVHKTSRLSTKHLPVLEELSNLGVEVYAQAVPAEKPITLKSLMKGDADTENKEG